MQGRWRVGNLLGIPFYVDASWIPIALLLTISYGLSLSGLFPELGILAIGLAALASAAGLFGSVLAHELAHSLVARWQGIRVNSITLFIFGGMAALEKEAPHPAAAFWVAAAGPAFSLSLFVLLQIIVVSSALTPDSLLGDGLISLSSVNLVIGLFNLLPGLPLDGGQMLKALVWGLTGDPRKGLLWAARSGQWVGYGLIGLAALMVLRGNLGGLWLGLIGLFILNHARNYAQTSQLQQALYSLKAKDVMTRNFRVVDLRMSVREFIDRYLVLGNAVPSSEGKGSQPVKEVYFAESEGRYRGMVLPERVQTLERSLWENSDLSALLLPMDQLKGLSEETPIREVIGMMQSQPLPQVVVLTPSGAIAGLIDKGDIVAAAVQRMGFAVAPEVLNHIRERNEFPPGFSVEDPLMPAARPAEDP
ncbi:MAG: site-2 protease family protein [Cyanobacteriota bacterium]|nr:site-2 protease family protein [Cyanobacteriota bacterium]